MRFTAVYILLVCSFLLIRCSGHKKVRVLPFIGNFDIEYKLVDGVEIADTIYPKIPFFQFKNEFGDDISSNQFKGRVWIVDFFFTSCQTICPLMTTNMKKLNQSLQDLNDQVQFISFSIDPSRDSSATLLRYKSHYGINSDNWTFLSGDEEKTHALGIENFQIFAGRDEESQGGYAHSGAFTLVDMEGFVRGVYLGTDPKQVEQLENDVRLLLKEEYGITGSLTSK